MKIKIFFVVAIFVVSKVIAEKDQKWSWGTDKQPQQTREAQTASKVENPEARHSKIQNNEAPVPEGRSFGLFEKLACKLKKQCNNNQDYRQPYPPPPFLGPHPVPIPFPHGPPLIHGPHPGPIPFPHGPPIHPRPIPIQPGPLIHPGPILPIGPAPYPGPIARPQISHLPAVGYPPRPTVIQHQKPSPTKTEVHHHTHTHIHEDDKTLYRPTKPYRKDIVKPQRGFSPTVVQGGSPISNIGNSFQKVRPESVVNRPINSIYNNNNCQCVEPQYCTSNHGKDISYLLTPRNEASKVISNRTVLSRGKRSEEISDRRPKSSRSNSLQGRQLSGYPPVNSGYPPVNSGYPPVNSGYPPVNSGYPPVNSGYPSVNSGYPSASSSCGYGLVCCQNPIHKKPRYDGACGRSYKSSIHGRIATTEYDAGVTTFGQYPWQGVILKQDRYESVFVCGATLVSGQHLLTAAHCLKDLSYRHLKVRLGEWDVNSEAEFYKHIEIPVQSVEVHPKYYAGNLQNDIAVLTLQNYVDFHQQPHISPVCLPDAYANFDRQYCKVSGWGKDAFSNQGKFQRILKEVTVPIVDRRSCEYALQSTRLGRSYHLPDGFLCAGGEAGKDACEGDGGGPLVCSTGGNDFVLAGIVSWGIDCGLPGVPGVYIDIPFYADWIRSIVRY